MVLLINELAAVSPMDIEWSYCRKLFIIAALYHDQWRSNFQTNLNKIMKINEMRR